MKLFGVSIAVLTVVVGGSAVAANRRPAQRAVRQTVIAQPSAAGAITVVPFAVPVAVPVAVISQPAVLYSYRQYASPAAQQEPVDPPNVGLTSGDMTSNAAATADPAVALLAANCAKCHTGAAPAGHLQMFDAAGQIVPRLPRRAIVEMASPDDAGRQRMPPGESPKLTSAELATLRAWARPPRDLAY